MSDRIRVESSVSGCWLVKRGDDVLDVKPPHAWEDAYEEACREAVMQNLGVIGIEIP